MRLLCIFFLIALAHPGYTQIDHKIDSLQHTLSVLKDTDTTKIKVLHKLSFAYINKDTKKSLKHAHRALDLSSQLNDEKGIRNSYSALGIAFGVASKLDSSLWAFQQCIKNAEKYGDTDMVYRATLNIGITYNYMSDYEASLNSYHKCLEIAEKNNLSKERIYGSIATTYRGLGDYKMSLRYDSLAMEEVTIHHGTENVKWLIRGNMAGSLTHLNRLKEAREILLRCIDHRERTNEKFYLSTHYAQMGDIFITEKNYNDAFGYYIKNIALNKEVGNINNVAIGYERLGLIDFLRKKIPSAHTYAIRSLELSDSLELLTAKQAASELLSKIALYQHDLKSSAYYDSIQATLKDSINLKEQSKTVAELKTKYETDKKEKENEILRLAQVSQQSQLNVQRYAIIMIGVTLVAVLILLFVVYRSSQLFKRTNALLKRKNEAIELQQEEIISQKEQINEQIKEVRRTQSQLIQSEKMASLGHMTSGIAHEINNPLNFISGGVEGLKYSVEQLAQLAKGQKESKNITHELEQEAIRLIGNISNGVHRAHKIITSLRTFSSPHGSFLSDLNVVDTIEMAVTMLHSKINSNQIKVIRNYSETTKPIAGNASELSQVFTNIIDNAIQAMEGKLERKELHIQTESSFETVTITITDTGRGIPQDIHDKIMEPFFTTKEIGNGTGLGLAISYGIIEKHHGKLTFSSEVGKGTAFRIAFDAK